MGWLELIRISRLHMVAMALVALVAIGLAVYFLIPQPKRIEGVKVLVIVAEGFSYHEYAGVTRILSMEGATITTASFTKERVSGSGGSCKPDVTFDEVNVSLYDVIYIPGGNGPYSIITNPDNLKVYNILTEAYREGKIIAAICHGPWVLAEADLVRGKRVTCWNDQEMINDLKAHGAVVDTGKSVIRDGNMITARGLSAMHALAEEIIKALLEKEGS